jgi:hypothetical protein
MELKQKEIELNEREIILERRELEEKNQAVPSAEKSSTRTKENNTSSTFYGEARYIPIEEESMQTASFILEYSNSKGANRPSISLQFGEGPNLFLNAVCDGDYYWCIRNEDYEDIGYMKIIFEDNGETANILIKRDNPSQEYEKQLKLLEGKVHRK